MLLGFVSGVQRTVEAGALILKALDKNLRPDPLSPGQGVLYSCEYFFLRGSLSPRDLIVNICAFINNFCIH